MHVLIKHTLLWEKKEKKKYWNLMIYSPIVSILTFSLNDYVWYPENLGSILC